MYLKRAPKELRLGDQLPTQNEDDDFYDLLESAFWLCLLAMQIGIVLCHAIHWPTTKTWTTTAAKCSLIGFRVGFCVLAVGGRFAQLTAQL